MMERIITREPVVVPAANGGASRTVYVDVPARRNTQTGEVFLGDEALLMLDGVKAAAMARAAFAPTRTRRRNGDMVVGDVEDAIGFLQAHA